MGVVGLMNSLPVEVGKLGLYSDEVDDETIRASRIIAIDLHWFPSLAGVRDLVERYRQANRDAKIVLGGYTATIYSDQIIRWPGVDFVIKGDAEGSFAPLVVNLLGGSRPEEYIRIPNLVHRDFSSPHRYAVSEEDFSGQSYSEYGWFPSFLERCRRIEEGGFISLKTPTILPYIPVNRGCNHACEFCYGSPPKTRALCGRPMVIRRPQAVRRDLKRLADSGAIGSVSIFGDGIDLAGEQWARETFTEKLDLSCYMEFFNLPSLSSLEYVLNAFRQCRFSFALYENHGESDKAVDLKKLDQVLKRIGETEKSFADIFNPRPYYNVPASVGVHSAASVRSNAGWHLKVPNPLLEPERRKAEYEYFFRESYRALRRAVARPFLHAITGLGKSWAPPRYALLDRNIELKERESRKRGCFASSVIDAGETTGGTDWIAELVEDDAMLFRFERVPNVGIECQRGGGEDESSQRPNLPQNATVKYACPTQGAKTAFPSGSVHGDFCVQQGTLEDVLSNGSRGQTAWRAGLKNPTLLVDLYSGGEEKLVNLARENQRRGSISLRCCFPFHLLDGCKLAADSCPAGRLSRVLVRMDRRVSACAWGRPLATVGASSERILDEILRDQERAFRRRGCHKCASARFCSKCPYPDPFTERQFCVLVRQHGELLQAFIRLLYLIGELTEEQDGTGISASLEIETSDEHVTLRRSITKAEGNRGRKDLKEVGDVNEPTKLRSGLRFGQLDGTPYLFDINALHKVRLDETSTTLLAWLDRGGLPYAVQKCGSPKSSLNESRMLSLIYHGNML